MDLDEPHNMSVTASEEDVVYIECSCGWLVARPGSGSDRMAPWSVREIVNISNSHLTAASS